MTDAAVRAEKAAAEELAGGPKGEPFLYKRVKEGPQEFKQLLKEFEEAKGAPSTSAERDTLSEQQKKKKEKEASDKKQDKAAKALGGGSGGLGGGGGDGGGLSALIIVIVIIVIIVGILASILT